jgi:hypothetical protein
MRVGPLKTTSVKVPPMSIPIYNCAGSVVTRPTFRRVFT